MRLVVRPVVGVQDFYYSNHSIEGAVVKSCKEEIIHNDEVLVLNFECTDGSTHELLIIPDRC